MFSFFKSLLCHDFTLLSRGVIAASSLSHFRRCGLTIHTGVREKSGALENGGRLTFRGLVRSAADMGHIKVGTGRFMSFCNTSVQILSILLCAELNDTKRHH
jgi:hypothetical protein